MAEWQRKAICSCFASNVFHWLTRPVADLVNKHAVLLRTPVVHPQLLPSIVAHSTLKSAASTLSRTLRCSRFIARCLVCKSESKKIFRNHTELYHMERASNWSQGRGSRGAGSSIGFLLRFCWHIHAYQPWNNVMQEILNLTMAWVRTSLVPQAQAQAH